MQYVNTKWVEDADAVLSVFDLSVLRGYGVFDFLRTYTSVPFELDAHIDRLFNSAKELDIPINKTKTSIKKIVLDGIRKNGFPETNVRIVVTGGISQDSYSVGTPQFIVLFTKATAYPDEYYQKGVSVITYAYERPLPRAKSINYLIGVKAVAKARKKGAVEAIFVGKEGQIYEGTTSNFFAVKEGTLITPKNTILIGITRGIVINCAKQLGIRVEEREVSISEIGSFDEAFITASNKEIMPVVNIDNTKIGNGMVGEITQKLMQSFRKVTVKTTRN